MPKLQDFYFTASEARGEYFDARIGYPSILQYKAHSGGLMWATEVTDAGAAPVSESKDLICVARNVRAEYIGRVWAKQGDLWSALKEA